MDNVFKFNQSHDCLNFYIVLTKHKLHLATIRTQINHCSRPLWDTSGFKLLQTEWEVVSFYADGMTKQEQYVLLFPSHQYQHSCIQFQGKIRAWHPGWWDKHKLKSSSWSSKNSSSFCRAKSRLKHCCYKVCAFWTFHWIILAKVTFCKHQSITLWPVGKFMAYNKQVWLTWERL